MLMIKYCKWTMRRKWCSNPKIKTVYEFFLTRNFQDFIWTFMFSLISNVLRFFIKKFSFSTNMIQCSFLVVFFKRNINWQSTNSFHEKPNNILGITFEFSRFLWESLLGCRALSIPHYLWYFMDKQVNYDR